MTDQQLLERITCDQRVMVGKPVIKGTLLTVEYILNPWDTVPLHKRSSTSTRGFSPRISRRDCFLRHSHCPVLPSCH